MRYSVLTSIALAFQAVNVLADESASATVEATSSSSTSSYPTYETTDPVQLWVSSESSEIDGKGLTNIHEGAGINYVFLTDSGSTTVYYDSSDKFLFQPFSESYYQFFSAETYVSFTVSDSSNDITFDENGTLLVNGVSHGFSACMNTNDPYRYSTRQYELMWYGSETAPDGCYALELTKNKPSSDSSASSSVAPESTVSSVAPESTVATVSSVAPESTVATVSSMSTVTLTTCDTCSDSATTDSNVSETSSSIPAIETANGAAAANFVGGSALILGLAAFIL